VGSGSGRILASIRERDRHIKLTGIDLSEEQTKLAKKAHKGKDINFVSGNGEKLPFKDNTFDYVIFFDYLEHIEKPQKSMNEMQRVLKKGGYIYFICPAEAQGIYWLSKKIFRRHFKEQTAGHIQQYKITDLENITRKAKLKIVDERFSYHLLGSIMDYTLFTLMLNKSVARKFWTDNKYYATGKEKRGGLFNHLLTLANAIAYYESKTLQKSRALATAAHITAVKS
jgi:SAM-dependent methyltransferase